MQREYHLLTKIIMMLHDLNGLTADEMLTVGIGLAEKGRELLGNLGNAKFCLTYNEHKSMIFDWAETLRKIDEVGFDDWYLKMKAQRGELPAEKLGDLIHTCVKRDRRLNEAIENYIATLDKANGDLRQTFAEELG
ncbi:hypothetical protein FW755_03225 [Lonepinella koalarum]|uniref:hypothetical protein n=1 Tax=Lonepinella koalarum TaxID=53417 RepID=UPI0011E4C8EF|nr:hypothetical protein [Lonepinella koalarum]TYG34170.1 hypothetical protein FW755_03225 [Lonepinella koalarum]